MRIDTSQIRLSTSGQYFEKVNEKKETRLEFSQLFDDRRKQTILETASVQDKNSTSQHEWSETRTIDNRQIDAHPTRYGRALYLAYEFCSREIEKLELENEDIPYEEVLRASIQRTRNLIQYIEYAPSLDLAVVGNLLSDPLGYVQTKQGPDIDFILMEDAQKLNLMQVFSSLIEESPVFDGPDSLLNDLNKMNALIEGIGKKLSALSNDSMWKASDPDYSQQDASGFKNIQLDWVNIDPRERNPLDLGGYAYAHENQVSVTRYQKENINFLADGIVKTIDGKSIDFSLELNLSKEVFSEELFIIKKEGYVFIDPLVITLNGTLPRLSEVKFSFDLDADGTNEDTLMLEGGSGFICLDKNKDGIINDGRELFGPATGNGFLELLQYDQDQNLWIDENDEVFDELAFWENDGKGNMRLTKIKDAGIGAIYLANSNTPMDILDDEGNVQAESKSLVSP